MWRLKTVLFEFLLFYFVRESFQVLDLRIQNNNRCQVFQVCDILPSDGEFKTQQQIERIWGRMKNTKQKILGIELEKAVRAERAQVKWRKVADKFCEAPEHKINKILGCDDVHMTHRNLAYFSELANFCNELLRIAERGANNAELLETVNESEQRTHSYQIYKQFKSLRSSLQQRCVWEEKRQIANRNARRYDERARKLRADAKKFSNLIENSLRIEDDNRVRWNLAQEQIEELLEVLGQQDPHQAQKLAEEKESAEEGQKLSAEDLGRDINGSVEIIPRKTKQDETPKTPDSEEANVKSRCKDPTQNCGEKLSVELTNAEINSLLKFLEKREKEGEADDNINFPQLRKLILSQIKTLAACERQKSTVVRKGTTPRAAANCNQTIQIELPENNFPQLVNILTAQKELQKEKPKAKTQTTSTLQLYPNNILVNPMELLGRMGLRASPGLLL